MNNKLITIVLTLVVGIILAGSVLVPVLNDATTTTDTYYNDGLIHLQKYDDTAEITAFWDHTKPTEITVDGSAIPLPITSGGQLTLTACGTPDVMIRYSNNSATSAQMSFFNVSGGYHASTADSTDMTITITGGEITVDNGVGTPITQSYGDYLFMISTNGPYVMKYANDLAYVNGDSEIYGIGRSAINNVGYSFVIEGTVDDGFTVDIVHNNPPTVSNVQTVYTEESSHKDLYKFEKITMTATKSDVDYDVVYNQVIVPYEVTAERSVHLSSGEIALIGAIPVMVIIALLIVAVGAIARRND